jgi:hypothetical protein
MSSNITRATHVKDNTLWVPEGYVKVIGPNDQCFIVPNFWEPALHLILEGQRQKKVLNIGSASGTVSVLCLPFIWLDFNLNL